MRLQDNLRYGYTTGTCAAAASKAALYMLINQKKLSVVEVLTPSGYDLLLDVEHGFFNSDYAECAVRKYAGDDPDVTNGLYIFSKVEFIQEKTIEIIGGDGVGVVTKGGLSVEVGQYAINPVPREMIRNEIKRILENYSLDRGVRITISIPKGEEIAKNTLNPKLGIKGGLSILGTTGIVKPMSNEAFENSLILEIKQLSLFSKYIVICPGNFGLKKALELGFQREYVVTFGNFLYAALDAIKTFDFKEVILVGELGKLIKVAGGIYNTYSKIADARKEIFLYNLLVFMNGSIGYDLFSKLSLANTTREMIGILREYEIDVKGFLRFLEDVISQRIFDYLGKDLNVQVILFSEGE